MTCWELFDKQSKEYKKIILGDKACFGIEAASFMGWSKYVPEKNFIGMNSFGASAPYKKLFNFFGITPQKLVKIIQKKNKKNYEN